MLKGWDELEYWGWSVWGGNEEGLDLSDFGDICDIGEGVLSSLDDLTVDDSSDEEGAMARKKWPEFNKSVDMENATFTLGMLFASSHVLVEAIKNYAMKDGKQVKMQCIVKKMQCMQLLE